MPLKHSTSNKARSSNIKREIDAGKPPAQAAAIAYSVQREARNKRTADSLMSGKYVSGAARSKAE